MRNPKLILLSTAFSLALGFSCKKKDTKTEESTSGTTTGTTTGVVIPPIVETVHKIKTEKTTVGTVSSQVDYTYDGKGRVTRMDYSYGYYATVEWTSDKCIHKMYATSNNAEQSSVTYNLDASGKATSSSTQGSSSTYEYNSDGYLVKLSSSGSGGSISTSYVVSGGNQVSYTSTNGASSTTEYFTDKKNTTGSLNRGLEIQGKQNKNLVKQFTARISGAEVTTNYTYEFDTKDRVTKMTYTNSAGTSVTDYTYYD